MTKPASSFPRMPGSGSHRGRVMLLAGCLEQVSVVTRQVQVLIAPLHAGLDLRRLHPFVERADHHCPRWARGNRAVPAGLVVGPVAAIANASRCAGGAVVAAGRDDRVPQLVWRDRAGDIGPAHHLSGGIRGPGDRVRADAIPRFATQDAEVVAVGQPHGVVFGIDLRPNLVPGAIVEGAGAPEEDHWPTLVADDARVIGTLFIERLEL